MLTDHEAPRVWIVLIIQALVLVVLIVNLHGLVQGDVMTIGTNAEAIHNTQIDLYDDNCPFPKTT